MNCHLSLFCFSVAALSLSAGPVVEPSSVTLVQPTGRGVAEISYVLSGAPAVVTVDIQTNAGENAWVSIGDEFVRALSGDVNRLVQPSQEPKMIVWKSHRDWPNHLITGENTRAVIEVWPTNCLPPYLVVDFETSDVAFYRSEEALPHPVTNDLYVTTQMVMRKIPAANASWTMGTKSSDVPKDKDGKAATSVTWLNEGEHTVTFTEDYYMAIYPITIAQYQTLAASPARMSALVTDSDNPAAPQTRMSHVFVRGSIKQGVNWPLTKHDVYSGSFLGVLRSYIGSGLAFDLPTEAQWEFACRAGTTGNWYYGNALDEAQVWSGGKAGPCDVRYSRNPWGLYGFYGNCGNLCLDWKRQNYVVAPDDFYNLGCFDPPGPADEPDADTAETQRITRGGYYSLDADLVPIFCRSGARYRYSTNAPGNVWSVRLVAPAGVAGAK